MSQRELKLSDDVAEYNRERWNELVAADIQHSRPFLDLTPASARETVDDLGFLGYVCGKRVLCLALSSGFHCAPCRKGRAEGKEIGAVT